MANLLVAELQGMNAEAVAGRYQEKATRGDIINANSSMSNFNALQLIKALHCAMYQCSEAPVYGTAQYLKWESFTDKLSNIYVQNLEEYDTKAWEINRHN